ncbi:hypothetical protein YTPLAS18_28020 [Nitrospira sp.]|nr:hypothetical protein YTPLAS18_28020 [Nitrospira sp.]
MNWLQQAGLRLAWPAVGLACWLIGTSLAVAGQGARAGAPDAGRDVTMTVRLLDGARNPLPDATFTEDITLLFPFLAGTLLGESEEGTAIRKTVRIGDRLRFNMDTLERRLQSAALPWEDSALYRPLAISAREAHVVRLGTLSLRAGNERFFDQTVLVDLDTKETLFLVYIDRACSLLGSGTTGTTTVEHELEFPRAGFHWVRVQTVKDNRLRLTNASPQEAAVGLVLIGLDDDPGRTPSREGP